jgi:hypothetical protein
MGYRTTEAATTWTNPCAPDAQDLPPGPTSARPARSARRSAGTPQPAGPPAPRPAGLTTPQRKEHRTHRAHLAMITIPARQSTTPPRRAASHPARRDHENPHQPCSLQSLCYASPRMCMKASFAMSISNRAYRACAPRFVLTMPARCSRSRAAPGSKFDGSVAAGAEMGHGAALGNSGTGASGSRTWRSNQERDQLACR